MEAWKWTARLAVVLIILGLFIYEYLTPTWQFQKERVPILATPNPAEVVKPEFDSTILQEIEKENKHSFNMLILGTDARKQEKSRADLIMLAHVNIKTIKVTLISIPRDTRVEIPNVGFTKINHAHMLGEIKGGNHSGTEEIIKAVSDLLQSDINYYLKINFQGFKSFVDAIGGIDIELEKPIQLTFAKQLIPAGRQHIDGYLALKLAKERYSLAEGDFDRQKHHRLMIEAIITKLSQPEYVRQWPALLQLVQSSILDTNLSVDDMLSLAWAFKGVGEKEISYIQIPGYSEYAWDPLVKGKVYYWIPNNIKLQEIRGQFSN